MKRDATRALGVAALADTDTQDPPPTAAPRIRVPDKRNCSKKAWISKAKVYGKRKSPPEEVCAAASIEKHKPPLAPSIPPPPPGWGISKPVVKRKGWSTSDLMEKAVKEWDALKEREGAPMRTAFDKTKGIPIKKN